MKKCPKCGASVDSSSKFCTNCGYSFIKNDQNKMSDQQNNTQDNINRNVENVKKYSNGYFSWFMKSIKKPSESIEKTHTYYGLTSFIISIILISFALFHANSIIFDKLDDLGLERLSDINEQSKMFVDLLYDTLRLSFIRSLALILILMLLWLVIGFVAKKICDSTNTSFMEYINKIAGYTNYVIIVDIVLVIISLITSGSISSYHNFMLIALILIILIPIIYNIGLSLIIMENNKNKIDRLYITLGAIIIDLMIAYEIIKLFF